MGNASGKPVGHGINDSLPYGTEEKTGHANSSNPLSLNPAHALSNISTTSLNTSATMSPNNSATTSPNSSSTTSSSTSPSRSAYPFFQSPPPFAPNNHPATSPSPSISLSTQQDQYSVPPQAHGRPSTGASTRSDTRRSQDNGTLQSLRVNKTHRNILARLREQSLDRNGIKKQETVVSVSLRKRDLAFIPEELYSVVDLYMLDLSENKLKCLPDRIKKFKKMRRLALGSNQLERIPDAIGELKHLAWLDFTHNNVHQISDRLGELQELCSLGASDCRIANFPIALCKLSKLRKLGLFNNLLTSIPPEIGKLVHLTKLDLSGNALTRLPAEIGALTELTWLNLSNNQLEELPWQMGKLTKLVELGLAFNRLKRIPDLSKLSELVLLPVYNNQLEEIDEWIGTLPKLSKLDLSGNQLTRLPPNILTGPSLTFVNLRRNKLYEIAAFDKKTDRLQSSPLLQQSLPLSTTEVVTEAVTETVTETVSKTEIPSTLEVLDLRENELVSLPWSLLCPSLIELKCAGNPFYRGRLPRTNFQLLSLTELCTISIVNNNRISNPPLSTHSAQNLCHKLQTEGYICEGCGGRYEGYRMLPIHYIEYRQSVDCSMVPFIVRFCLPKCRRLFERQMYGRAQ